MILQLLRISLRGIGLTFMLAVGLVLLAAEPAAAWRSNFGSKSQFPCAVDPASCAPPSSSAPSSSAPSSRQGSGSSEEYSTPRGEGWFCRAESRSGAWGWAEKSTEADARNRAIQRCHEFSKGQACRLKYCRLGGGSATSAGPGRSPGKRQDDVGQREVNQDGLRQKQRATVDCSQCETIMQNTIRARIGFANKFLLPQTVRHAVTSFASCERKTETRTCDIGRILVRSLNNSCRGFLEPFDPQAYERCIATNVP